jgi:hypothetical protein
VFSLVVHTLILTLVTRYGVNRILQALLHLTSKHYVADGTDLLFKAAVVSSGTTIGDLAQTDIGANVAGVDNTGDSTSGNSRGAISQIRLQLLTTLPFRIVGLVEETKNSSGGYTEAYVKWNAGHQYNNTTGV